MWKPATLYLILLGGCASQLEGLTPEEGALDVYWEEPDCEYDKLGPIRIRTAGDRDQKHAVKMLLTEAVNLGASGVIVHYEGPDVPLHGGIHTIRATAINCIG
jgi:hypothetical protein